MRQGGCSRDRTYDRWLKRPLLYQLSYTPKNKPRKRKRIRNVSKNREIVNLCVRSRVSVHESEYILPIAVLTSRMVSFSESHHPDEEKVKGTYNCSGNCL